MGQFSAVYQSCKLVLAMSQMPVCPSVKRMYCDKMKESSTPNFYTIWKKFYPSFPTRRIVGGDDPLYLVPEILGQADPDQVKMPISIDIHL